VLELKLRRKLVMAITFYGAGGDAMIQLKPAEFLRVFHLLRVRRATMDASLHQGNLHATFKARQTEFSCVVRPGDPELEALTPAPRIGSKAPRIENRTPRIGSRPA